MPWRQVTASFHESIQARIDYTLATAAMSAPLWLLSMADVTNFFVMLAAIGGTSHVAELIFCETS